MRVARRETLTSILVLSMFIVTMTFVPEIMQLSLLIDDNTDSVKEIPKKLESSPPDRDFGNYEQVKDFYSADETSSEGILDSLSVEQRGYASSGYIFARTDMSSNLEYNLPIDRVHSWLGSEASISIWNLTRLYVVNGTLDEGIPGKNYYPSENVSYRPYGWDSNSTNIDPATNQTSAYYVSDSYYMSVEDQGKTLGTGINERSQHVAGTEIMWFQTIPNAPYNEEFVFSTSYLYKFGPLNPSLGTAFTLVARINGAEVWSISLSSLAAHDIWYNTGDVAVNLSGAGDSLFFEIGLKINSTEALYHNVYDILDAHYITAFLDDVSLIGVLPPALDAVDLQFHAGTDSIPITGTSGTGSASISNSSYWNTPTVAISVSSNTSVSFNYLSTLLSHRFTETTWKTDLTAHGVSYTADFGASVSIDFYAYVGYFGFYQNPTMHIVKPNDWAVTAIYDSSPLNVTSQCSYTPEEVTIPGILLDNLGWWHFELKSPNYAKSVTTQIFNPTLTNWSYATIFRISNTSRVNITIGSSTEIPSLVENVNVSWFLPSGAIWLNETPPPGSNGEVIGNGHVLASGSSPAGQWWVQAIWSNGTEVAYGRTLFQVQHTAELVADPEIITTDTGLTVTGIVRYTDEDTGANLLDPVATIEANWSLTTVPFVPNTIQNWWEGTFDTSLLGPGKLIVIVNASRLFYDDISCQIEIQSTRVTRLNSPNAPWTADVWGHNTTLTFNYEYYNYATTDWNPIQNTTNDVSLSINWPAGYWSVEADITPGIYVVSIDTSARNSSTWLINATFSKPNHQPKTLLLTLIISPKTSSLSVVGEISARVNLDAVYNVTLSYRDGDGSPIKGAIVFVDSVFPSTGLSYTAVFEVSGQDGYYSTSLSPHVAGVFTIRFVARGLNVENATTVFVLVVNDVQTELDIDGPSSVEMGLTDTYNTTFRFAMLNGTGISDAMINITYSGGMPGALSYHWVDIGLGDYSVEFNSTTSGTYLITIAAFKQYYQSDSSAFFLVIREISTQLTSLNGT
ncbi:MAG: hypothetical protein OEV85_10080, partial [Candidatus Thorarchaeota archaeon]|nr:hypothetical protein [Candidatus Thorarchaeota archaeon]